MVGIPLTLTGVSLTPDRRVPISLSMDCFVYVLGTTAGRRPMTYVGWTTDVAQRLARHNAGTGARSTRGRQWVLLHVEQFASKPEAMSREWHLKRDRTFRKRLCQDLVTESVP